MPLSDNQTLREFYQISEGYIGDYKNISVDSLPLSTRIVKCLKENNIETLGEILSLTRGKLSKIRGFRKTALAEIDAFCVKLSKQELRFVKPPCLPHPFIPPFVSVHYTSIISGDFSFSPALSELEREYLGVYQEAYQNLGGDLVQRCVNTPEKITPISSAFYVYFQKDRRDREIQRSIGQIPATRREKQVGGYIRAFTTLEEERGLLRSFWCFESAPFTAISSFPTDLRASNLLEKFLEWCTFDLPEEIHEFFCYLHGKKRVETVLELRSQKQTLAQVGKLLGITRERVRQIEKKARQYFDHWNTRARVIPKIAAEQNGQKVLSLSKLEEYCGANTQKFVFLLQGADDADCIYMKQLEAFIVGDPPFPKHMQAFEEAMPNIVTISELSTLIKNGGTELDIPEEILSNAVFKTYQKTGNIYHRGRFAMSTVYGTILKKYYHNGIKVYNPQQLEEFRQYIRQDYGDIGVPENDRALIARIADVGIICDRGTYGMKKEQYIPADLADRIYQYITDSPRTIFLTSTIFSTFEKDLSAVGIGNKYYLQGVLRELYSNLLTFRKDYISKNPFITSIYTSVVGFIKSFHYPVNRHQIKAEFPGISDVAISFAVNDSEVLNLFGGYLHASQLVILEDEQKRLSALLEQLLCDGAIYHVKELYDRVLHEMPEILTRNAITAPFGFFSVLEYFFREQYQFSRPYVGANGIEIGHPAERLHELLYSADTFSVSDIREFMRDNHFQVPSLLEYMNTCNDRFLLIDADTAMDIAQIGISEESAHDIDDVVASVITETIPIRHLDIWDKLPPISVPWTDWLVYSVLYKWGTMVSVSTSSQQFRYAIPLVSPAGQVNSALFRDVNRQEATALFQPDDLDNIDALLENMIDAEILEVPQ